MTVTTSDDGLAVFNRLKDQLASSTASVSTVSAFAAAADMSRKDAGALVAAHAQLTPAAWIDRYLVSMGATAPSNLPVTKLDRHQTSRADMNAIGSTEVQLNDRFTYGASPFGDRVLTIAFAGPGSIMLALVLLPHVSVVVFSMVLAGFLTLSWLCYKRLLKVHSDVVLDESGITRYVGSRLWLSIPWASVEKVMIQRVYGGGGDYVGAKGYYLSLKPDEGVSSVPSRKYKIQGKMSRHAQFYDAFLANLRTRGISVDERDTGAP